MSERAHRRRVPVPAGRRSKQSHPHPSPSPSPSPSRRYTPPRRSSSKRRAEPVKVLKRCSSEPLLWDDHGAAGSLATRDPDLSVLGLDAGVLIRPLTCTNAFASSPSLMDAGRSALCSEQFQVKPFNSSGASRTFSAQWADTGYNKDAKVVVNVTVEGSPGPIKALVQLGSTVDQTIKLVVGKYSEEGRTPKLNRDSTADFELHHSYFSLQFGAKYIRRNVAGQYVEE